MSTKYITDDTSETGWVQTGQTLLRRGWSVGKKVGVAGAAISVAPVVIPPLMLFSAFGLALSVPFGIYYGGVAGTERLMQSLLPLDQGQEMYESLEEEKWYLDERDSRYDEIWEKEGDDQIIEEEMCYAGQRGFEPEENGDGKDAADAIIEYPAVERTAIDEESGEMNKRDVVVESLDERHEKVETESGKVSERDYKPEKVGETNNNNKVAVERVIDISSATVDKDFVTTDEVEITASSEGLVQVEAASTELAKEKEKVTTDTHSKAAKKGKKGKKGSDAVPQIGLITLGIFVCLFLVIIDGALPSSLKKKKIIWKRFKKCSI